MEYPQIIQGGMGIAVSNWCLAKSVAELGQLGIVSGTSLDNVCARRLQMGDPDGHMRRAIEHFPFPEVAQRVLDRYYVEGGKDENKSYAVVPMYTVEPDAALVELTVVANFAEVFLAGEGHDGLVGINYLEKIQMPNMISIYGALLAGVDYIIMGAGIPREIPGVIDCLSRGDAAQLKISVDGEGEDVWMHFDPKAFDMGTESLKRPNFLAIISSVTLGMALIKRATGEINGFVVELPVAGGHNAPPRGKLQLDEGGEPIYGPRDEIDLEKIAALGKPFWVAGSFAYPGRLREVLALGGQGIQVGTAFAFCEESGLDAEMREEALRQVRDGELDVYTDPVASPTGFPFKVVQMKGTLAHQEQYSERPRVCNLGYLRTVYRREDGAVDYRCASEPVASYLKKGGESADTEGRKCLCNALMANVSLPQRRPSGYVEKPLFTAGDDLPEVIRFLGDGKDSYSAADVVEYLLASR
ncbi:MAG: nitronate monooxygenase [Candidatus Latescibacterota bacterium]|jgi:nitronate monooxygenase